MGRLFGNSQVEFAVGGVAVLIYIVLAVVLDRGLQLEQAARVWVGANGILAAGRVLLAAAEVEVDELTPQELAALVRHHRGCLVVGAVAIAWIAARSIAGVLVLK